MRIQRLRHPRACLLALAGLLWLSSAQAARFSGTVTTPDGQPAFGAMLTVANEPGTQRETVYTDGQGHYRIDTPFAGKLTVRARLANHEDSRVAVQAGAGQHTPLDLQLKAFATPMDASDALAASAHNATLPWARPEDRVPFVSQCNYCHQIGNATTRVPRSHESWLSTIRKMEGMWALLSGREARTIAGVLERGFTGAPVQARHDYAATTELARAKVQEWLVGDALSFIHDLDVGHDQKLYGTDEGNDILWILDRDTGTIEKLPLPDIDLPRGGKFSGMKLPIGVFSGKHGPHSMAQTRDGRIWITNALSSTLMSFDPATKAFKTYPVGHDALYPHTVRVDRNDVVWFTIVASNQIGRFDPKTETMTVLGLPSNGLFRWISDRLMPTLLHVSAWFPDKALLLEFSHHKFLGHDVLAFPYGIDVNPVDGSIWYTKLYANKIGRVDSTTLEVTEYDTPLTGPRRPRFDRTGVLWIPAFNEGALMRFDPRTRQFQHWKIPGVAANEYETPYALNVHPDSGDIWMSANNSDRVLRFIPASQRFISYPSPVRVTVLRDFSFTRDGKVCSSQSNWPAYAIEDHVPSFLCIDPNGAQGRP